MKKNYSPQQYEEQLYSFWEENGYFTATINQKKKPYSIILPPPNANADLHVGHAMYVYEDIMIRYHKLMGYETLWLAGADHAGIETQFVYEKHLRKQGKSRLDFDRETLYQDIWDFVMKNRGIMENQLRRLGFALDWSKKKFTMDEDIVRIVNHTFKDLFDEGLVYRANRLVNYCTSCGTSFSDLEVKDKNVVGSLYYIHFPVKNSEKSIIIATTRPETMLGDVGVMVHPKDKRYKELVGKTAILPITNREVPIIADEYVDPEFGTGAVKITPSHDFNDFEVAKKHNLTFPSVIDFNGHMQNSNTEFDGMYVKKARKLIIEKLKELNQLEKVEDHEMVLKTCYRCGTTLEPLPKEQWFINVDPLKKEAIRLVEEGKVRIFPRRFRQQLIQILENFIDWNISRQIAWGIRIPAYYSPSKKEWYVITDKEEFESGDYPDDLVQDEDTFDTWFSSGQWPFATLQAISTEKDDYYNYYYPTTVMETGFDIMRAWVSRMIMLGYFQTKKVPFENVFLHGMVRDGKGQKMSKSKGNVVNPLKVVDQYGADALRAALVFGSKEGGDVVLSDDKIRAMRNFGNKVWNIGRFLYQNKKEEIKNNDDSNKYKDTLRQLEREFEELRTQYHDQMKRYKFAKSFDLMYEFVWHRFADFYIEELKDNLWNGNIEILEALQEVYFESLKLLHPYTPFVTEAIWQQFHGEESSILDTNYVKTNKSAKG